MVEPAKDNPADLVFTLKASMVPALDAWMLAVEEKVAKEQVRTGRFQGWVIDETMLQRIKDSLERGDPRPYGGVSGGAYSYCFIPTSLGCIVKVRNDETGDEIDLTDYDAW